MECFCSGQQHQQVQYHYNPPFPLVTFAVLPLFLSAIPPFFSAYFPAGLLIYLHLKFNLKNPY